MNNQDLSRREGERLDAYLGRLEEMAKRPGPAAGDRAALTVSLAAAWALLRQQQAASASGPPSAVTPTPTRRPSRGSATPCWTTARPSAGVRAPAGRRAILSLGYSASNSARRV
jgi:hypothetical protein